MINPKIYEYLILKNYSCIYIRLIKICSRGEIGSTQRTLVFTLLFIVNYNLFIESA